MKKSVIYAFLFCCSFLGIENSLHAQAKLGIQSLSLPDSVSMQEMVNMNVVIQNKGDSIYHGTILILFSINDTNGTFLVDITNELTINPGDSIINNSEIWIDSTTNFQANKNNVVVVWPVDASGTVETVNGDSVSVFVNENLLSIEKRFLRQDYITLFPNPAKDQLFVHYREHKNDLEHVGIFNLFGQMIYSSNENTSVINLSNYQPGIYYMELMFKGGNRITKKFIKEPF